MRFFKLLYVLCFFLLTNFVVNKKFKLKLIRATKCSIPEDKKDPAPPTYTDISTRKVNREVSLINANFSITKKYGPVVFGGRGYQLKDNAARDLIFKLEKISCHNPISFQIIRMANLKFDKNCFFEVGNYRIVDLNIQNIEWVLTKSALASGKYAYELDFSYPKGITSCIYIICELKFL